MMADPQDPGPLDAGVSDSGAAGAPPRREPVLDPRDREQLRTVLARSRTVGFLGDGPVDAHIDHALSFARAIDWSPRRFLDLGSGGGVPGLVLAVVWSDAEATLLDAQQKRCAVLRDAVEALDLGHRVTVERGRAEEFGRDPVARGAYDVVTARSFGQPAVVAECAAPLLRPTGVVIVSEPPDDTDRWPTEALAELGLQPEDAPSRAETGARIKVLRRFGPIPDRFPRRVGVPAKRPLF